MIVSGRNDDVSLRGEGPGVPVHGAIESGKVGGEVGGGYGCVLEGGDEVDWVPRGRHYVLEGDFPAIIDGVLAEYEGACSALRVLSED